MCELIYADNIAAEMRVLYERFDDDFELIQLDFIRSMEPFVGFLSESKDEKESGGVFAMIRKMLISVRKLLTEAGKKLKSFLFGAKIKPGSENEKVRCNKDIGLLVKFVNGDIKSSTDYLKKAASGKISADEAKRFVQNQNNGFDAIKSVVVTAAGALASVAANKHFLEKWKQQADDAINDLEATQDGSFSAKVSNQYSDENKRAAVRESVAIISAHLGNTEKRGVDALLAPLQMMYQQKYISNKITADAASASEPKGLWNQRKKLGADIRNEKRTQKEIKEGKKRRDKYNEEKKSLERRKYAAKQDTRATIRDSYADTRGIYVDEDNR